MRSNRIIPALILLWCAVLSAQENGIYHQPPDSIPTDRVTHLEFIVIANYTDITWMQGFFRTDSESAYQEKSLWRNRKGLYVLAIKPEEVSGDTLYYFVATHLDDGRMYSWPPEDPETEPQACPLYVAEE